jgi:hypothetical protein
MMDISNLAVIHFFILASRICALRDSLRPAHKLYTCSPALLHLYHLLRHTQSGLSVLKEVRSNIELNRLRPPCDRKQRQR